MRSIDLYTAMRVVDDDILERSENAAYRQNALTRSVSASSILTSSTRTVIV